MKERHVIIRTQNAGVFKGILVKSNGQNAILKNARRIWYWAGAASLSELAMRGVSRPGDCRFPIPMGTVKLTQVIELIDMTPEAIISVDSVPIWSGR